MPAFIQRVQAVCLCMLLSTIPLSPAQADEDADSVYTFIEQLTNRFNTRQLDAFIDVFTDDAMLMGYGEPVTSGKPAIRSLYADAFSQYNMEVGFNTEEVRVEGDMAYEMGTYFVIGTDMQNGDPLFRTDGRHIHIMLRAAGGQWQTWRLMTYPLQAAD